MSYTSRLKDELSRTANNRICCRTAELAAIARSAGELLLTGGGNVNMVISTESELVASRVCSLCTALGAPAPEMMLVRRSQPRKMNIFTVRLNDKQLLERIGIGTVLQPLCDYAKSDCCCAAVLRGAFMGSGMLADPVKQYCAEFSLVSEASAQAICELLGKNGIECRRLTRGDREIVSVRDAEGVVRLVGLMGGRRMLLEMENVRVVKTVRNNINRHNNCDTANIDKTVNASVRQCALIKELAASGRLNCLSPALREMAAARLNNPDAPLSELADELGISRSAVNNRLRALCKAAEEL